MTLIEDLRSVRVQGIAVLDVGMTVLAGVYLSKVSKVPKSVTIPGTFLLGYAVHGSLGIKTKINK